MRDAELSRRNGPQNLPAVQKEKDAPAVKHTIDYSILVAIVAIVCFGLLMVYSASYYSAADTPYRSSASYYFQKQLIGAGLGVVAMIFFAMFDYHNLAKFKWIFLVVALAALVAVFIPGIGIDINGSKRWIDIKITTLQPSELVKFALIVFMASTIAGDPKRIKDFKRGLLPYIGLLGVIVALIIKQPNFSAIVCITLLMFTMLIVGGCNMRQIIFLGVLGVIALTILMIAGGGEKAAYRISRLVSFTDPFAYADDEGYQVVQSLYALGGGGLFGRGLGNSVQKLSFLPYSESDFIFSIIAEELGLMGCILVVLAFAFLVWRGVRVAMGAPDKMGMLLATGVMAIIAIQVIVHIGVVTSSLPATGVALPFISYGSSGLIIFMGMIGIVLNVSRQTKKV